ncbi:MAG TPA: hypothetical protein VH639_02940 [Bryobacteraceae bacterium]|jgi:hypothetical protein
MGKRLIASLVWLAFCAVTKAQLNQEHPELCGARGPGVLPQGLTAEAATGPDEGNVFLKLGSHSMLVAYGAIDEVCILPGQILTFNDPGYDNFDIYRLDAVTLSKIDDFVARIPVISPDGHWLMHLPFFHFRRDPDDLSEEYLLYDLTKDGANNRLPQPPDYGDLAGLPVYPVPHDGLPFDFEHVPSELKHRILSNGFFWNPESSGVLFADSLGGRVSVVWVDVAGPKPITLVHPIEPPEEHCGVATVDFEPQAGPDRLIILHWGSYDANGFKLASFCASHTEIIHLADFVPPKPEVHIRPKRTGGTLNGAPFQ